MGRPDIKMVEGTELGMSPVDIAKTKPADSVIDPLVGSRVSIGGSSIISSSGGGSNHGSIDENCQGCRKIEMEEKQKEQARRLSEDEGVGLDLDEASLKSGKMVSSHCKVLPSLLSFAPHSYSTSISVYGGTKW
ncbi:predicted protein [Verticillium alfalfae VaMs.102]|uniref:Predicted protein n=1 Tax=Verticillium alfalfae (strain VaMs.102 / ATCC MYA-4576 / FGSC 10136) TaxID=526221 RepID=C9SYP3_VERA1|nr:predicted protein [Verticillium alfalfae VaMs.102]EEY23908.1 predicted protein [Verticillium alfalfae VaMs.102]